MDRSKKVIQCIKWSSAFSKLLWSLSAGYYKFHFLFCGDTVEITFNFVNIIYPVESGKLMTIPLRVSKIYQTPHN